MADSNDARSFFIKLKSERDRAKILLKHLEEILGGNEFLQTDSKLELDECLDSILEIQNALSQIERLKEILEHGNLKRLEEEISKWEDDLGKDYLRGILMRLLYLEVEGQEEEKKFCAPLKKQVEIHLNRESKIPLAKWLRDGQKFIRLAKLIENPQSGSYEDFNQINKDFGDKIQFLAMRGIISIPEDIPESKPKIEQKNESKPEKTPAELAKEFDELVGEGINGLRIDVNKFILVESEMKLERFEQKKDFTISKLKSRLIEISIAGREIIKKLLEDLCLRNVTSVELFIERHKTSGTSPEVKKRRGISVEKLLDALFRFGYVNLCTWHGMKFYFVDSSARQVLSKVHGNLDLQRIDSSQSVNSKIEKYFKSPDPSEFQNFEAICNLRRYMLIFALWKTATPLISEHIKISSDARGDWIIADYQTPKNCLAYFFNLTFTHEHCSTEIFRFTYEIQKDLISKNHPRIVGAFLVTTRTFEESRNWLELFESLFSTLVTRKDEPSIKISILCIDENSQVQIFDVNGNSRKTWDILEKPESISKTKVDDDEKSEEINAEETPEKNSNEVSSDDSQDVSEKVFEDDLEEAKSTTSIETSLDALQLATLALNRNHRAQAMIALSTLSEDQKFNIGFDFSGDFVKINFDSQMISILCKMFQRYLPDVARDAENILQVAVANFPPVKSTLRPAEKFEPVDLNDFQVRGSILKAIEILDKLKNASSDSKHSEFIRALIKSMKARFTETNPAQFNFNRFFDECLLGGEYLELNQKGIPTIFDSTSLIAQLNRHLNSLENCASTEIATKRSFERALKEYDLGTLKLITNKFEIEATNEIEGISKRIGKQFEIDRIEFLGDIEFEYLTGSIQTVEEKNSARELVSRAFIHFSKTQNEGLFRRLICDKIPMKNEIQDEESIHRNHSLDDFLHDYGNLFRICTQDPSREVEVRNSLARFESIQPPEDFEIKIEDRALKLDERREIARDSKLDSKSKNILVIDQIAAMYLNQFNGDELNSKLLQITLPFANFQPKNSVTLEYVLNSGFELSQKNLALIQKRTLNSESVTNVFYRQCIESIAEGYRQGIFRTIDSPPYKLDARFLKIAMSDGKFNDSIDSAFRRFLANEGILATFQSIVLISYRENVEKFLREQIVEIFEEYALKIQTLDSQIQRMLELKIIRQVDEKYSLEIPRSLAGSETEIESSLLKLALEENES